MKLWIDAQLPPALARWIQAEFQVEASGLDVIGMRTAADRDIFVRLRQPDQVIVTKDEDFVDLVTRLNPPPQILWITCGNVTNRALRAVLATTLPAALAHLRNGEPVVEITGP